MYTTLSWQWYAIWIVLSAPLVWYLIKKSDFAAKTIIKKFLFGCAMIGIILYGLGFTALYPSYNIQLSSIFNWPLFLKMLPGFFFLSMFIIIFEDLLKKYF